MHCWADKELSQESKDAQSLAEKPRRRLDLQSVVIYMRSEPNEARETHCSGRFGGIHSAQHQSRFVNKQTVERTVSEVKRI